MGTSQYRMWLGYSSCKQGFIAVVGGLVPFILSLSSSLLHLMHQPSSLQAAAHSGLVPWATLLLMALCHLLCHRAIVVLVPPTTHPTNLHTKERWDKTPWRASSRGSGNWSQIVPTGYGGCHGCCQGWAISTGSTWRWWMMWMKGCDWG